MLNIFTYVYCPFEFLFSSFPIHFHCPFFLLRSVFSFTISGSYLLCFWNVNPLLYVYKYSFTVLVSVYDIFYQGNCCLLFNQVCLSFFFFFNCFWVTCFARWYCLSHGHVNFLLNLKKTLKSYSHFKYYRWYKVGFFLLNHCRWITSYLSPSYYKKLYFPWDWNVTLVKYKDAVYVCIYFSPLCSDPCLFLCHHHFVLNSMAF